jgi:hypothetical protein
MSSTRSETAIQEYASLLRKQALLGANQEILFGVKAVLNCKINERDSEYSLPDSLAYLPEEFVNKMVLENSIEFLEQFKVKLEEFNAAVNRGMKLHERKLEDYNIRMSRQIEDIETEENS